MREWLINLDKAKFIDLSYPMQPGMTLLRPIYEELEYKIRYGSVPDVDETGYPPKGFYARFVNSGSEGLLEGYGTHVEASSHPFGVRGRNIDEYPLSNFIGPGVVINVTDKVKSDPEYKVTVDDLLTWKRTHGEIPDGAIIVLNNGWGDYWGDYNSYFGVDDRGEYHYPGITPEACQWLVDNCRINAIGTDTATIDGRPAVPVPG
ncbi:cyclase family protein, partial [Chloroflexota bacterium]